MKKVCKAVFCAVAILLLGIFSQQGVKAGETNEKHYSRAYSVLSANVGNAKDPLVRAERLKLQPNSDEEKRVISGIKNLKPDILILIEASNKEQVLRICNGEAESYSVYGGPYDFICVKNEIIAKKDNGEQDIEHVSMPEDGSYNKYKGNSVGYVDVGLKDENSRKARLFYAHFPAPFPFWTPEKHKAHKDAFDWICRNLNSSVPCLIAGDLNNDFTRGEAEIYRESMLISNPLLQEKYREEQAKIHSSLYIEKRVKDLKLWIFNPLAQPLQLQFLDGSTEHNYEATHRPELTVGWETTIDWVMGKFCVPPFLAPGGPETDLITGTTGTIRTNFVTSPPDWWKDTSIEEISRITFDHKPLFGKVVFFWEAGGQPDILATYISEKPPKRLLVLKRDNTFFFAETAKWEYRPKLYWCYYFPSQRYEHEDEDEVSWEKGNEQVRQIYLPGGETGERFSGENVSHVLIHKEGEVIATSWSASADEIFEKEKSSKLIAETPGRLWSKYVNCDGNFLEFRKDGTYIRTYAVGNWGILEDLLITIPTVHDWRDHLDYKHEVGRDNIHKVEGDKLLWGYTGAPGILEKGDRSHVFVSTEPGHNFLQANWGSPNKLAEKLKQANKFNPAKKDAHPPAGALVFFSGLKEYKEAGYAGISLGDGRVIHAYQSSGSTLGKMAWIDTIEEIEDKKFIADSYLGWAYPPEEWYVTSTTAEKDIAVEERDQPETKGKDWKEYKIGALSFSVPSNWEVYMTETGSVFEAWSTVGRTDRKYAFLEVGVVDGPKDFKIEKRGIIHYDRSGGKIEDPEAISPGITITHPRGQIVDSFKTEIAGQPVTVCVLRRTGESMLDKGIKFIDWPFYLFAGGKHHLFTLTGVDPDFQRAIFKELVSRIRLSPKTD